MLLLAIIVVAGELPLEEDVRGGVVGNFREDGIGRVVLDLPALDDASTELLRERVGVGGRSSEVRVEVEEEERTSG